MPETIGRVAKIEAGFSDHVSAGEVLFRLDNSTQKAALETARRQVAEVDANFIMAQADLLAADGQIQQAQGAYDQALDELRTKQDLFNRNPDVVARREIERLQNLVDGRQGGVNAAKAGKQAVETRISTLLPAQKASAEAALQQAQVDARQDGDPCRRQRPHGAVHSAGRRSRQPDGPPGRHPHPDGSGRKSLQAGFGQIEAQVMQVGMVAEAACVSKPWAIIPMVVTSVQDYIAAGQFRGGEQLIDARQVVQPGTLLVVLEPLYSDGLDGVTPGSSCIANAYSNNHDRIVDPKTDHSSGSCCTASMP